MRFILPALFFISLTVSTALADADVDSAGAADPQLTDDNESAASFDKRLPPVLPGEEVKDGKKKMKVWSTSGPVPVNPEPPAAPQTGYAVPFDANIGVIVERQDKHRKNHRHDHER